MGKRKKNKKKSGKPKGPKQQQDSGVLMREQKDVLAALRGRRASALGEKIYADETVPEMQRIRSLAVGHEAYLRDLLAQGHVQQAEGKARKLVQQAPRVAECWALSLQLRLGMAADVPARCEDPDWLKRLRAELVDPEDLCGIETRGLGEQAQTLLNAWALIEQERDVEALEPLTRIGRRSPLVDWRLFLQVLVEARRNEYEKAATMLPRMLAGCPAHAAAEQVVLSRDAAGCGPYGRRLKALEERAASGALKRADYSRVQTFVKKALADHRPGMATTVAASFTRFLSSQQSADSYFSLFARITNPHFSLERVFMRDELAQNPREGLLQPDIMDDVRRVSWDDSELPRVWIRLFEQVRRKWDEIILEVHPQDQDDLRHNLLGPLLEDCRRLSQVLPDCRELFEFWVWAERECRTGTDAVQAYAEAFSDDEEVVANAIVVFAGQNWFDRAESWLKNLSEKRAGELRQSVLYYRIRQAFMEEDTTRVDQLAAVYCGPLLERIKVCVMRWRGASRAEKRKRGLELVAFESPWLVFYCAIRCENGFRAAALPAGLKRSLAEDSSAVVRGYLELLRIHEREALTLDEPDLDEVLCKALNTPGVPVELLRPTLLALIMRHKQSEEILYEADGFIGAFKTLVDDGTADDQALAIVLRMQAVYETGYSINFKKAERSFRVAWSLAEQDETRRMVSRIFTACRLPMGELPKKPATQKMIDAELKMQRKFRAVEQVNERYCIRVEPVRGEFNPFEGMDLDDIEKALGPDYDTGRVEDPWDEPDPVVTQPYSKPFTFSRHPPLMEWDFERVAFDIETTTCGKHRRDAAETFKNKVDESTLSRKAKARLMKVYHRLLEGA